MTERAKYGSFMLVLSGVALLAVPIRSALGKVTPPALIVVLVMVSRLLGCEVRPGEGAR